MGGVGCWRRIPRRPREEPLFEVLGGMDRLASPRQPLRASVWISLLAAPLLAEARSWLGGGPPPSLSFSDLTRVRLHCEFARRLVIRLMLTRANGRFGFWRF